MEETEETPAPFESAVAEVTKPDAAEIIDRIAKATPKEMALICRKTFFGVEALLEPLTISLSDRAIKSVEDSTDSLTKIYREYMRLKKQGGIDVGILAEIDAILPDLKQARSYINSALSFLRDLDLKNNKVDYNSVLPVYERHIMNAYDPILNITIIIRGRPDITPEDIAKEKQKIIDTG